MFAVPFFLQCQEPWEPPLADIEAPIVDVPRVVGPAFGVRWSTVAGALLYEIVQSTALGVTAHWFTDSTLVVVTADRDGRNLFRVRGWTDHPTMGIPGPWSRGGGGTRVDSAAIGLFAPDLIGPDGRVFGPVFSLSWSDTDGATLYELVESSSSDFKPRFVRRIFFTADTIASIPAVRGNPFFRVRAWNALPENGGFGSRWSPTVRVSVAQR